MYWLVVGIVSVVILVFALLFRKTNEIRMEQLERLKDPKALRSELRKWEAVVLCEGGTIRGLKMFANRTRLICACAKLNNNDEDLGERQIRVLVGFSALANSGTIDQGHIFKQDDEFTEFKNQLTDKLNTTVLGLDLTEVHRQQVKMVFEDIARHDWEEFSTAAINVRFPKKD